MNKWLACALVAFTSGCPDIKTDPDETSADPIVEFDPGRSIVPFPNNLLIDQMTGKVTLPAGCNESAATKATRENVLNKLDGFGTFETAMSVTLTKPIDMASVTAENVLLFELTADPGMSNPIPVVVIPSSSIRFANQTRNADGTLTCDTPNPIDSIVVVPRVPLKQKTNYAVALKSGLKTSDGASYVASFTWSLVRQQENPVTVDDTGTVVISDRTPIDPSNTRDDNMNGQPDGLEQLLGINRLWNAHKPIVDFLGAKGHMRDDLLLAWSFRTQTTTDALDTAVAGTPLAMLNDVGITGPMDNIPTPVSVGLTVNTLRTVANAYPFEICDTGTPAEPNDVQCFLKVLIGLSAIRQPTCTDQASCQPALSAGTGACAQIYNCLNVADVLQGRVRSPQFQANLPNALDANKPIPGPFADPVKPAKVEDEQLTVLIAIPAGVQPAAGWPTAVFQHGLGQSNMNIIVAAGSLARDPDGAGTAASGIATVAINAVAHGTAIAFSGDRRVQINNQGTCATNPGPSCFSGFLSPDLGTTRDNIRQTAIDHAQLVASLKKCTGNVCGATFNVNAGQLVYIGQSLGGIIGGISTGIIPDFKASVLNVPGVGWADIFENTDTLDIRCTLVDGLIDAGTLVGEKRDTKGTPTESDDTGLCVGQEWKTQPGYRTFAAIGRWVLDPADPANFIAKLAPRKSLIQEVVGDRVVPNIATMNEAALLMRPSAPAATNTTPAGAPPPSPAICMGAGCLGGMTTSKYVRYTNVPPNLGAGFPGNTYTHGSLLSPATSVNATMPSHVCSAGTPQYCDGVLALAQMVVDAVTFLQLNK